ncbi:hypothetical protein BC831DRAFT_463153 [Entophlyctis helioformis]|nr:hypothetical protein BC831DRAFT_463153 [Entophlyctis helioformis]
MMAPEQQQRRSSSSSLQALSRLHCRGFQEEGTAPSQQAGQPTSGSHSYAPLAQPLASESVGRSSPPIAHTAAAAQTTPAPHAPDTDAAKQTLADKGLAAVSQYVLGMWLAVDGTMTVLTSRRTRRHLLTVLLLLALYSAVMYGLVQIAFLPLMIARSFVKPESFLDRAALAVERWISWWLVTSPDLGLLFVRYIWPGPLDTLFFDTLRDITVSHDIMDPRKARFALRFSQLSLNALLSKTPVVFFPASVDANGNAVNARDGSRDDDSEGSDDAGVPSLGRLAQNLFSKSPSQKQQETQLPNRLATTARVVQRLQQLGERPRKTLYARLMHYLNRYWRRLLYFAALSLAAALPVVGWLCWPLASLQYFSGIFGWELATGLFVIAIVSPPWWRFLRGSLLKRTIILRSLGRELVEPYLCRSFMTSSQRRAWFNMHQHVINGFTLVFFPFIFMPWIGPLIFGIAQGAAARLSLELFDPKDYEGHIESTQKKKQ